MFVRAWLLPDGCIRLHEHKPSQVWDGKMFHRGYLLSQFKGVVTYDTKSIAVENLDEDLEHFLMEFEGQGECIGLWFRSDTFAAGIPSRLDRWRGCYGKLPIKKLQEQRVSSRELALVPA